MKGQFDQRQVTFLSSKQPNERWIYVVKGQRGMSGASASGESKIIRRVKRSEDQLCGELLEGIPNEVTLVGIAAKLPYRTWQIAGSLSPDWHRAFEDGMVYNARVFSQATETFVVFLCKYYKYCRKYKGGPIQKRTLSLFSPSEKRWYKLPRIPGFPGGMPINSASHYVALDSSIYILGGNRSGEDCPHAEVLVLDLAKPPLEWRRCADMQKKREEFSVGVLHGKIFVFGGICEAFTGPLECSNEVYDPKLDAWSWIAPLKAPGSHQRYSVEHTWSVGQQLVCRVWLRETPTPNPAARGSLSSAYKRSSCMERFFVQEGARGPFLCFRSPNHGVALDQMDGLHRLIESERIDKNVPFTVDPSELSWCSAGKRLELYSTSLWDDRLEFWTYDPLKDDWGVYEAGNVDLKTVHSWDFLEDSHVDFEVLDAWFSTEAWTMSF